MKEWMQAYSQQMREHGGTFTRDERVARKRRARKQVENAPKKGREAKLEELANKMSNLRAVAKSPPSDWSVDRRREDVD
jgi:guanosine-3',5'-bis(diphosphate) 3'-pyrophosphohydrolase